MRFEHLIEINNLNNPFMAVLTREQLWGGLLCRVEAPQPFLPGLERCEILERCGNRVERLLDFGPVVIRDCVTLTPRESVHFEIQPGEAHAGGSLTITIEDQGEGALFLRFVYVNDTEEESEDAMYVDYVQSAYQQSDVDTVRLIREMAAQGRLLPTVH